MMTITVSRALVGEQLGEQLWTVGFHEVGLKLLEEFGFDRVISNCLLRWC